MNKQKWTISIIAMIMSICISLTMLGCTKTIPSSSLSGDVIKENKTIKDSKIACLQDAIKKQSMFKHTFKYDDSYPPTLYVYITGEWSSLDDKARDSTLIAIGKMWQSCNPENRAVLTVMAYDSNNIPLLAVFVTRE